MAWTARKGNGGPGRPIQLPGTTPVYTFTAEGESVPVVPYHDLTTASIPDAAAWPGVLERPCEHHVDENNHDGMPTPSFKRNDEIDQTIGGRPGLVNRLPYSTGVVSSNMVENFDMTGAQIRVKRQPENQWGPVSGARSGGGDFSAGIAQTAMPNVPDWIAQSGITEAY